MQPTLDAYVRDLHAPYWLALAQSAEARCGSNKPESCNTDCINPVACHNAQPTRLPSMKPLDSHFRAASGCSRIYCWQRPTWPCACPFRQSAPAYSFRLSVRHLALLTLPIALAYRLHAGHLCNHAKASARFFIFCYAAFAIPCMMQLDSCDHY